MLVPVAGFHRCASRRRNSGPKEHVRPSQVPCVVSAAFDGRLSTHLVGDPEDHGHTQVHGHLDCHRHVDKSMTDRLAAA